MGPKWRRHKLFFASHTSHETNHNNIINMYCGDETGSFVGDIGSSTARFGYGGDISPSYVVPSIVMEQQSSEGKILHATVPTSCYNWKANYDYRTPMRRVQSPPAANVPSLNEDVDMDVSSPLSSLEGPITDPVSYLQQGDSIADWDAYEQLWLNALNSLSVYNTYKHTTGGKGPESDPKDSPGGLQSSTLRSVSEDTRCIHPFLVVSPGISHIVEEHASSASASSRHQKEMLQLTELMMETLQAPALFVAPTPMLAAFSHGRQTALLVDIGAGGTRVTPLVDGLVLKQAQRRTGRGTDWLQNCLWQALSQPPKSTRSIAPRYQVKHKSSSSSSLAPNGIFHRWAMNDLMQELRTCEYVSLPQWWYDPTVPFVYDEDDMMQEEEEDATTTANTTPSHSKNYYELPDGTSIDLSTRIGKDICRVPELLFSETCPFLPSNNGTQWILDQHPTLSNLPLHQLINSSLSAVADVDARRDLAATIVLTGGGVLPNLAARLSLELSRNISSAYKPKVLAQKTGPERQCAAWIGGSILTSLGSFQQLWLSKAEYDEYGGTLAIQRFP